MFRNFNLLLKPDDEGLVSFGDNVSAPELSYPTDSDLANDGFEIDDGDLIQDVQSDDLQSEKNNEDMEHVGEMTEQQMLDELAKGDNEDAVKSDKDGKAEEFKIPEDFKDVLKRGDELHHVSYKEMKELAQKGFDYTKKTQEVAEERKELETVFSQKESELSRGYEALKEDVRKHQEVIENYNKFDYALQTMKEKDPDLFAAIAEYANEAQRVLDNPVNKGLRNQISKLEEMVQSIQENSQNVNAREKNELIAKTFYTDLNEVKSKYSDTFKKLGLVMDEQKLKEAWINGEKANITVDQALFQVYGPQITKLFNSKMAVKTTAAKIGKAPAVTAGTRLPTKSKSGRTDWRSYENEIINQVMNGSLEY